MTAAAERGAAGAGARNERGGRTARLAGILLAAVWLLACGGVAGGDAPLVRRPNVLWISADDHAPYVCGAWGNKLVRTPNLDRLAASGLRFDRAFCNSPICTASRQSFLTGRYPRTIRVSLLQTALPEGETTLAEMLAAAGYDTAAIGKMHFNSGARHGFALRLDAPDWRREIERRGPKSLPPGVEVQPPWRPFKDPARVWLNSRTLPFGAVDEDMAGTYFARCAAEFIRQERERPFFLMVSFTEPHSPFQFPVEFRGRHDPARFEAPKLGPADLEDVPAIFRDLSDEEKRGIIAAYYTSVEFLDRNVGLVLDALDASGRSGDTIVVYTGDHGYLLGHHGRFEKHTSFEEAVRSPLILRLEGRIRAGGSTAALVEFVDIVPTVLDVCGIEKPASLQGGSLLDLAVGKVDRHRERVFVEYGHNEEMMVRDERWKLVFTRGKRRRDDGYDSGGPLRGHVLRLYDLASDPGELQDLARLPEQRERVADLLRHMAEFLRRTDPEPERVPASGDPFAVLDHCVQPRDR